MFRRCALRVLAPSALRASDGQRPVRESIFPFRTVPQFSMVVPLRSQARLWHSLLHWAYSALFRAQRARFVRPSPSLARCSVSSHRPALRLRGVPALRPPFGRVLAPPAASRPSIAHYASLRVLGTSALRAFTFLQAFASTVRNRRSASLASSLAALVAHWAHFGLFRSSIRNSRLATLPLASLLCSLDFRFACFAHCARRSSVPQAAASVRPAKNARNDVHAVISDLNLVLPILCQGSVHGKDNSRAQTVKKTF